MDQITTAANGHLARMHRMVAFALLAALATMGSVFIQIDSAAAAPASTQGAIVCHTVTIPKSLPWWSCVNFGTYPAGNGPYGCYTHTKRVCD